MSFRLEWHPKAFKMVEALPLHIRSRVLEKLDSVVLNPFRFLEPFTGGDYKLRIGEYRILCSIDFDKKMFLVNAFDKRERIYR